MRRHARHRCSAVLAALIVLVHVCRCAAATEVKPYLLHLPGIGGHMAIDDLLTSGLHQGGLGAEIEIHDWTDGNAGLAALTGYERNQRQAGKIAERIQTIRNQEPARRIIVSGHSAGCGLAVWALEKLPDDVHIDTLLMIAPALSPQYDLSKALRHVRDKAYALSSEHDAILGGGTRTFGTVDRVKTDAAGRVGFTKPDGADDDAYGRLVSIAYDSAWIRYGNMGDHIGAMMRPFARQVLAPLLISGQMPKREPTSAPATRQAREVWGDGN